MSNQPIGLAALLGGFVLILAASGVAPHTAAEAALANGDPVAGKTVSAKCMVCHTFEPGKNKIGPSLAGVVGRKAGLLPDFNYSSAMKGSGLTWDAATLDRYLTAPRTVVPGTKMIFAGLPNAADRANIIAFLSQIGRGVPAKK